MDKTQLLQEWIQEKSRWFYDRVSHAFQTQEPPSDTDWRRMQLYIHLLRRTAEPHTAKKIDKFQKDYPKYYLNKNWAQYVKEVNKESVRRYDTFSTPFPERFAATIASLTIFYSPGFTISAGHWLWQELDVKGGKQWRKLTKVEQLNRWWDLLSDDAKWNKVVENLYFTLYDTVENQGKGTNEVRLSDLVSDELEDIGAWRATNGYGPGVEDGEEDSGSSGGKTAHPHKVKMLRYRPEILQSREERLAELFKLEKGINWDDLKRRDQLKYLGLCDVFDAGKEYSSKKGVPLESFYAPERRNAEKAIRHRLFTKTRKLARQEGKRKKNS